MRARLASAGFVAACSMACGSRTPSAVRGGLAPDAIPVRVPVSVSSDEQRTGSETELPPLRSSDVPTTIAYGYALWTSGRTKEAIVQMRRAVTALEVPGKDGKILRRENGTQTLLVHSDDGAWLAAGMPTGVLVFDARTGEVSSLVDVGTPALVGWETFLPGTNLVTTYDSGGLVVFDAVTRQTLAHLDADGITAAVRGMLAYVSAAEDNASPRVHLWDTTAHKDLRVLSTELSSVTMLTWVDPGRLLSLSDGGGAYELFDATTGEKLLAYSGAYDTSRPVASPDGQWLAYAVPNVDDTGFHGKTTLVSRSSGKSVGVSSACTHPTSVAFSASGKLLAIGDLRRLCLLQIPSLRLITKTAEIRASAGIDDDLQNVMLTFRAHDSLIDAATADGSVGLFDATGRLVWKGRGETFDSESNHVLVVDRDQSTLWSVAVPHSVTRRALTSEENDGIAPIAELGMKLGADVGVGSDDEAMTRAREHVCHVGEWVFPRAACESGSTRSR